MKGTTKAMGSPIKVSVILPVYNVGDYLRQCLDSILGQSLREIEVICVDDGSTDHTPRILDEYAAADRRMRVIHQVNAGAGAARNVGLDVARGEYLFFCDPDDFCRQGMLKGMYAASKGVADVVVAWGWVPFDDSVGKALGYKVLPARLWTWKRPFAAGDRPEEILSFCKSVVWDKLFRRDYILSSGIRFQCIPRSNDVFFVKSAMASAGKVSLAFGAWLCHRRKREGSLQMTKDKSPFCVYQAFDALRERLEKLGLFESMRGSYALSLLNAGLYELRSLREPENAIRSHGELKRRLEALRQEALPAALITSANASAKLSRFLSSQPKKVIAPPEESGFEGVTRFLAPFAIAGRVQILRARLRCLLRGDESKRQTVLDRPYGFRIDYLDVRTGKFHLYGSFAVREGFRMELSEWRLAVRTAVEERSCPLELIGSMDDDIRVGIDMGRMPCQTFSCSFSIPAADVISIRFEKSDRSLSIPWSDCWQAKYSPLSTGVPTLFALYPDWLIRSGGDCLRIERRTLPRVLRSVLAFAGSVLARGSVRVAGYYVLTACFRLVHRRPIWLISDRVEVADDNGNAFFSYCASLPKASCAPEYVFAVSRSSPDFARLAQIGKVVDISGLRYKLYFLSAAFCISAYHTGVQRSPFGRKVQPWLKLLISGRRFVYLKHGLVKDDMSRGMGRSHLNARILVAASRREYESFLDRSYRYSEREVRLCGMPRYDLLYDAAQKNITFMPTWRTYLVERHDFEENELALGAEDSACMRAYRELFGNERLKAACRRFGYTIRMMPHPNMRFATKEFGVTDEVEVLPPDRRYRDVFADSGIVVTDFSSVFFDVAYLKKPLVYFQPDREEFFANQYEKGYFDYDADGFGEVERTVESLVDRLEEYMAAGAKMKEIYRKRVDEFFAFTDKNNCKRVYEAILKADAEDREHE